MKCLIAEDDSFSRKVLVAMLEPYGEVISVENGTQAVHAFQAARDASKPFNMVCLDVEMPDMDGCEALRRIRQAEHQAGLHTGQEVVVVMTTAVEDKNVIQETFVNHRAAAYMVKPVRRADLLTILRDFHIIEKD